MLKNIARGQVRACLAAQIVTASPPDIQPASLRTEESKVPFFLALTLYSTLTTHCACFMRRTVNYTSVCAALIRSAMVFHAVHSVTPGIV